jgi:type I restriction enzyme S subunit
MKASYVFNFEDVMTDITSHFKKIDTNQYRNTGATPIVDQSAKDFCGYTDIEPEVDSVTPPYIIFGDHTRRFKFIDVDFVLGADGTKVLKAKVDADHKYLFHFLNSITLEEAGYSRHYKYLKRTKLFVPPLAEQQRIAALLERIPLRLHRNLRRQSNWRTLGA